MIASLRSLTSVLGQHVIVGPEDRNIFQRLGTRFLCSGPTNDELNWSVNNSIHLVLSADRSTSNWIVTLSVGLSVRTIHWGIIFTSVYRIIKMQEYNKEKYFSIAKEIHCKNYLFFCFFASDTTNNWITRSCMRKIIMSYELISYLHVWVDLR